MEAKASNYSVKKDFADMETKLRNFVDKGRAPSGTEIREEPMISIRPDVSLLKPLQKKSEFSRTFMTVDCSTRTLKRANSWGVYLIRPSFVAIRNRVVNWGFKERNCTVVGDDTRSNFLTAFWIKLSARAQLPIALLLKAFSRTSAKA